MTEVAEGERRERNTVGMLNPWSTNALRRASFPVGSSTAMRDRTRSLAGQWAEVPVSGCPRRPGLRSALSWSHPPCPVDCRSAMPCD